MFKSKRGSIYIEASAVMPLTCLIVIGMITIAISFYNQLNKQVEEHKVLLSEWTKSESNYVWEITNP